MDNFNCDKTQIGEKTRNETWYATARSPGWSVSNVAKRHRMESRQLGEGASGKMMRESRGWAPAISNAPGSIEVGQRRPSTSINPSHLRVAICARLYQNKRLGAKPNPSPQSVPSGAHQMGWLPRRTRPTWWIGARGTGKGGDEKDEGSVSDLEIRRRRYKADDLLLGASQSENR